MRLRRSIDERIGAAVLALMRRQLRAHYRDLDKPNLDAWARVVSVEVGPDRSWPLHVTVKLVLRDKRHDGRKDTDGE